MKRRARAAVLLLLPVLSAAPARADMGPKPEMEFQLVYQLAGHPAVLGGEQRLCKDAACREYEFLHDYGPQGFACQKTSCFSLSYGYDSRYHQLSIRFSDKTRTSNVFESDDFYSTYSVYVHDDALEVTKLAGVPLRKNGTSVFVLETLLRGFEDFYGVRLGYWPGAAKQAASARALVVAARLAFALAFTLLMELGAAWAVFRRHPRRRRLMTTVLAANLISVPLVWLFCFIARPEEFRYALGSSELATVLFEGLFLFGFNRESLTIVRALALSAAFNALSFFGGELLSRQLPFWLVRETALRAWLLQPTP